jgi:selenocysteine-specific translation elongation factor
VPTADFRYVIDAVFAIPGRGTVAVGDLVSGHIASGEAACLHTDAGAVHVDQVWVEVHGKRLGLLLKGVSKAQVPHGTLLKPCTRLCGRQNAEASGGPTARAVDRESSPRSYQ